MAKIYTVKEATLTGLGDAVRTATKSEEKMTLSEMTEKIGNLSGGGVEVTYGPNDYRLDQVGHPFINDSNPAESMVAVDMVEPPIYNVKQIDDKHIELNRIQLMTLDHFDLTAPINLGHEWGVNEFSSTDGNAVFAPANFDQSYSFDCVNEDGTIQVAFGINGNCGVYFAPKSMFPVSSTQLGYAGGGDKVRENAGDVLVVGFHPEVLISILNEAGYTVTKN